MGVSLGHVGPDALGLITLVGLVTIALSTYMILYSQPLYEKLAPMLHVFERRRPHRELAVEQGAVAAQSCEVIVFGLGRYGERLMRQLRERGVRVLGVDFDPEVVARLRRQTLDACFGDAEDENFLESLPLAAAKWIVTSLPGTESTRSLLGAIAAAGAGACVSAVARDAQHQRSLHAAGLQHIINPFHDAADHAAQFIAERLRTWGRTPGTPRHAGIRAKKKGLETIQALVLVELAGIEPASANS
jgi:voltage-gated potassium channel Kch